MWCNIQPLSLSSASSLQTSTALYFLLSLSIHQREQRKAARPRSGNAVGSGVNGVLGGVCLGPSIWEDGIQKMQQYCILWTGRATSAGTVTVQSHVQVEVDSEFRCMARTGRNSDLYSDDVEEIMM